MEIWKTIEGYKSYEVSNIGRIRRLYLKGYRYRKEVIQHGYNTVTFSIGSNFKKHQVHRLVALCFIENIGNKPYINHIDGNKRNNNVSNLEWCTPSENEKHSFRVLGKITNGLIRRKIDLNQINVIKDLYENGSSQTEIAKKYNVSPSAISLLVNNKTYIKHV